MGQSHSYLVILEKNGEEHAIEFRVFAANEQDAVSAATRQHPDRYVADVLDQGEAP